jgi:hypothetical protein
VKLQKRRILLLLCGCPTRGPRVDDLQRARRRRLCCKDEAWHREMSLPTGRGRGRVRSRGVTRKAIGEVPSRRGDARKRGRYARAPRLGSTATTTSARGAWQRPHPFRLEAIARPGELALLIRLCRSRVKHNLGCLQLLESCHPPPPRHGRGAPPALPDVQPDVSQAGLSRTLAVSSSEVPENIEHEVGPRNGTQRRGTEMAQVDPNRYHRSIRDLRYLL